MDVVNVAIDKITPYEKNPRKNDKAVAGVAASIKEFGFQQPIVLDADGVIIAGHTRFRAAKLLELTEAPCVYARDLSPDQVRAYRLADNKVGEASEWDERLLMRELDAILNIDMSVFGFIEKPGRELSEVPEIEFSEELREEHNYVVLYFDNEVDWLQAETLFGLKTKGSLPSRRDGKITAVSQKRGVGRVLRGAEALERLRHEYQH